MSLCTAGQHIDCAVCLSAVQQLLFPDSIRSPLALAIHVIFCDDFAKFGIGMHAGLYMLLSSSSR
jgi:hypothetical protein